jgi:hypothetical protein
MVSRSVDPFNLSEEQLRDFLFVRSTTFPELETVRSKPEALRSAPLTLLWLDQTQEYMSGIEQIPQTTYTQYRHFLRTGDRRSYQTPEGRKRTQLSMAALRLFLMQQPQSGSPQAHNIGNQEIPGTFNDLTPTRLKDIVQDYLWNICEESNWVWPAHEMYQIDLAAAELSLVLAEILHLLGETLDAEVRHRVRAEIERRIFDPYLRMHHLHKWYSSGQNNWSGFCNGAVAATFLLLEPEPGRLAQAVKIALDGLRLFLETAFEEDGSSTEGVGYWHYGLENVVILSEMLYARSGGAINLLATRRVRAIASYPAKLQLSGTSFASFSDSGEQMAFNFGIVSRLAERSGEASLYYLLAHPARPTPYWNITTQLRTMLWWDGHQPEAAHLDDARLESIGIVRMVTKAADGAPVVLVMKAGHNQENHNHNDVGSFIVHVDGENLLTDPGGGLYNRDYFSEKRYENIFANSYGHSVPRIGGNLQAYGRAFAGDLLENTATATEKQATVEFARAYPCPELVSARRQLRVVTEGQKAGMIWLSDHFAFNRAVHEVEEALITWLDCEEDGATALVHGQHHTLKVTIEQPQDARFQLEALEEPSRANGKTAILKRLSFVIPAAEVIEVRLRMELMEAVPLPSSLPTTATSSPNK